MAVRGVRSRVGGRSRLDTLNKKSEPAIYPHVGRRNTHLVPGRGTVDTHGFADIAITRLEDAFVVVCGHVPGALEERNQGLYSKHDVYNAKARAIRTPITS